MEIDRKSPEDIEIRLAGELSIYGVAALHDELLAGLGAPRRIRLDLDQVEECDTAGLQWLLALRRWALARDVDLQIEAVSEAVREMVDLCQAHRLLGLQALIPAEDRGQPNAR